MRIPIITTEGADAYFYHYNRGRRCVFLSLQQRAEMHIPIITTEGGDAYIIIIIIIIIIKSGRLCTAGRE